jgi:proton-translocating NADH-quinone oxidoreductase chain N
MINQQFYNLISFLPELFLICSLMFLLIWCVFVSTSYNVETINYHLVWLLIESFFFTLVLVFLNAKVTCLLFFNSYIIDIFTSNIKILVLIFTLFFFVIIYNSITDNNIFDFEFLLLFSFSIFASLLLVSSYDLITLYLSIELQSLCFYILAAIKRTSRSSSEAGLKYFILGACSSSLLLFGMSLIYGFTGSTNFGDISNILISLGDAEFFIFNSLILGFLFLLFGFFFKLTIVPFHV